MTDDTVRAAAQVPTNVKTRRAALGALASIPALALPVVAMAADSAPQLDPVFAAIEAHRAAWVTYLATYNLAEGKGCTATPEEIQASDDANTATEDTLEALLNTPPTTMAGLKTAIAYFIKWDEGCMPEDSAEYLATILESPLFTSEPLQKLPETTSEPLPNHFRGGLKPVAIEKPDRPPGLLGGRQAALSPLALAELRPYQSLSRLMRTNPAGVGKRDRYSLAASDNLPTTPFCTPRFGI